MFARLQRNAFCVFSLVFAITSLAALRTAAFAHDDGGYRVINLTSNEPRVARHQDPNLINGWGMAFFGQGPFWLSDNITGVSTLYDHGGNPLPLVVTIPPAPELPAGSKGSPAGIIANPTNKFVISQNGQSGPAAFIYASLDGTISGWNPGVNVTSSIIAVDRFSLHTGYTGLAFDETYAGPWLYAADAVNDQVDVYGGTYNYLFSFTDHNVPSNLGVYGVQTINDKIVVTFASIVPGQGGAVDVFDQFGNLLTRLASNGPGGPLEAPWGTALAPSHFGQFSNALLVGNVDDGHISAYNFKTGAFLGQMRGNSGLKITIPGLWALQFGAGNPANGAKNQLFFAAGQDGYRDGLFGMIAPVDPN